ncbi:kinase-like domain-containing protein [Gigaspora rosea]|uniref:Kinase-like domain-containing protein n=1 Tax=Gigaspora rosea TaxID=44941 RepID=A0A397VJZ9_9GLOM|nr:kinase-like domain-containing protein [Gigaspora rosea]
MIVLSELNSKKDRNNGKCKNCDQYNTSPAWCQTCDPQKTIQGWTSGNKKIDASIKEFQLEASKYENVIEWIPFGKLEDVRLIKKDVFGSIFSAIWLDGIRRISGKSSEYTQSRTPSYRVGLKTLSNPKKLLDFLKVSKEYEIYGITQNKITNEYMLVFDEFYSKRVRCNGNCTHCNRYNTSKAWCQTCDPKSTAQGWTSGNTEIDNYIINFQFKSTEYESVIEWIPFNRLNNVQKNGGEFLATWLDGARLILRKDERFIQSRTKPCIVALKVISNSHYFLEEFTNQMKIRNNELKIYGITKFSATGEYMIVFKGTINDEFVSKRKYDYGKCTNCNRFNTSMNWCKSCDPYKITLEWISGDEDIDNCIKEFQLYTTNREKAIEWIPFDKLNIIEEIGKGGFGTVFLASWQCSQSIKVALKTLPGLKKNSSNFLKEFKSHMRCRVNGIRLIVYGLTQNTKTEEYMMVFQYENKGNLHNYLTRNFEELMWEDKLSLLIDISNDLIKIHEAGYTHCDLHCGNILLHEELLSSSLKSYISDLGLSRKNEELSLIQGIYGVMSYVAPEVLLDHKYTSAADIYNFGVIMAEMTTGIPPFYGCSLNIDLALKICKGARPDFAIETPNCYIELARLCMHSDSQKRPTAKTIHSKLSEWYNFINRSGEYDEFSEVDEYGEFDEFDETDEYNELDEFDKFDDADKPDNNLNESNGINEKLEIIREFRAADMKIPELSSTLQKYPNVIYSSRFINTHDVAQKYHKEKSDQLNAIDEIGNYIHYFLCYC